MRTGPICLGSPEYADAIARRRAAPNEGLLVHTMLELFPYSYRFQDGAERAAARKPGTPRGDERDRIEVPQLWLSARWHNVGVIEHDLERK